MRTFIWAIRIILFVTALPSGFAGQALWTITALDPTSKELPANETVTIRYQVTNHSKRPHRFALHPIPGVTGTFSGNGCPRASGKNSGGNTTCLLTLSIDGAKLTSDIKGGPLVCESGAMTQCYQPDAAAKLNIVRSSATSPGTLALYKDGIPLSTLNLLPLDSGAIEIKNIGKGPIADLSITIPSLISSYFTSHCSGSLTAGSSCFVDYTIPSPVATLSNRIIQAAANNATAPSISLPIKISVSGGVKCWGRNYSGQLGKSSGVGTQNASYNPNIVTNLGAGSGVMQVALGAEHSCALLTTGAVKCWGLNNRGQLGSTTNLGSTSYTPLDVQTLGAGSGVVDIAAGYAHSCAVLDTGAVKCWGQNDQGQLGSTTNSGTYTANDVPLDVQTLGPGSGAISVTAGDYHTCALLNTGAVKCWGQNNWGQLGSTTNLGGRSNMPLDVIDLGAGSGVVSIRSAKIHNCALLDTGALKCWGNNSVGQLGAGTASTTNTQPVDVQTLGAGSGVVSLTAGDGHTCALLDTGAVKCWGQNTYGQLGTAGSGNLPRDLPNLTSGVVTINSGGQHTCALLNTGAVQCWGLNYYGQIGTSTNRLTWNANMTPTNVNGMTSGVKALSKNSSWYVSCAVY